MIKLYLEVGSASKFTAALHRKQRMTIAAGKEAVHTAAQIVYDDSQERVPFVTGALWASGKLVHEDDTYVGRSIIGYGDSTTNPASGKTTDSYAADIHEKHKWLENAMLDNATQVGKALRDSVSNALQN